jgi:lysophospholipase L1-like esterase
LRQATKVVLVNLLLFFAGVVVIELCFGAWLGNWYDPRLRVICNVEYHTDVASLYPASGPAIYRRDRWGLRGSFDDPRQVDILTIGGSTTDQRFITEGETWQDRLAQHLIVMGRPVVIANAGIDGQSTVGHIAALDGWLFRVPQLRPRLVLIYAGINDVLLEYKTEYDAVASSRLVQRIRQYVEQRSVVLALFRTAAGMILAVQGRVVHGAMDLTHTDNNWIPIGDLTDLRKEYAARLDDYATRLETLDHRIRAWGAVPIFVTQPRADRQFLAGEGMFVLIRSGSMDGETRALSLFNERTMSFCRDTGNLCVDLARNLALGLDDYYDFSHNNPKGAAKIGGYLAPYILEQLSQAGLAANR